MNDNICVCCGGYAPEGHMVCYKCLNVPYHFCDGYGADENRILSMILNIKLGWFARVHDFVKLANKHPYEVYLLQDNYRVSGKSLMGVYSLDISKPVKAEFCGDTTEEILQELKRFIDEECEEK